MQMQSFWSWDTWLLLLGKLNWHSKLGVVSCPLLKSGLRLRLWLILLDTNINLLLPWTDLGEVNYSSSAWVLEMLPHIRQFRQKLASVSWRRASICSLLFRDKLVECCYPSCEFLDFFDGLGWCHIEYGLYLLRVCFYPSLGHYESQELSRGYSKDALLVVQLHLVLSKCGKCFLEVV